MKYCLPIATLVSSLVNMIAKQTAESSRVGRRVLSFHIVWVGDCE
jgi:hypothetical protein